MKKGILLLFGLVVLMTGCTKKEEVLSCTLHQKDVVNGYELNSTYEVHGIDGIATKTVTKEVATTSNETLLDYFEETLKKTYEASNANYGGYDYHINRSDKDVVANVTIDYEVMNLESYIHDQPSIKNYTKDGKLKLEGLKVIYEAMGATCTVK